MENNWLNLMNLLKGILIPTEMIYQLKNKKKFNELDEERSYEFQNLKEKSNSNNLIYKYKTQGRGPKDFGNFQNPIDLFDFKSDIEEIKKEIQS